MTTHAAKTNPKSAVKLADFPISANQITEGKPVAKIWINAQSADLKVTQGVWDCTAGKFNWDFTWDEFVMVLEGEVTITSEGGPVFTLRKDDFAHFPLGLKTKWHVPKYVKKTFVIRTPEPLKL
ncbi:MAG: DUF861 domain-containing protein [Verrucomicrobia bacterium]|nr:DUF861 domain-containing protein [Verrucomicrobiota bacterium]